MKIDLTLRKKRKVLPLMTSKGKYSSDPHPLMRLSRLALPQEANENSVEVAVKNFSTSVTVKTQSGYATAARAYMDAENSLGRPFSAPPSDKDLVYLIGFLIQKGLEPTTIRNYLSGIRFYLFSLGVISPPSIPPLANQLLIGYEKSKIDPQKLASKKTR